MPSLRQRALSIFTVSLCLKLLLFPTPHSTDLEVHRHWKALTYNLPLSKWYTDTSSKWTLDYPPLFAYFEYSLAHLANLIHPPLINISNHNYATPQSITFMRSTVLLTDPLLTYSVYHYTTTLAHESTPLPNLTYTLILMLFTPGLYLIDNIHFQYNALPISLLLLSPTHYLHNRPILASTLFSLSLNLKHTLLPIAPAIAIHILSTFPTHLPQIFISTLTTFLLLWFPFYTTGGLPLLHQILHRLFPFNRGLLHAYWAPNLWALYAIIDKAAFHLGLPSRQTDVNTSRGIIGATKPFAVLPNPTPTLCSMLLVAMLTPLLFRLHKRPHTLPTIAALSALTAFLFGWHVHEKAILIPLIPLAGLASLRQDEQLAEAFLWLSVGGQYGLFPLVAGPGELMYRALHFVAYHIVAFGGLLGDVRRCLGVTVYALGCVGVELYVLVGHKILWGGGMEFLPLLLVSGYSAVGVLVGFVKLLCSDEVFGIGAKSATKEKDE